MPSTVLWTRHPQIRMTVFLKRELEYIAKVAWWIIFLTVIALLLLLAIPVVHLWKVNQISLWRNCHSLSCGRVINDDEANWVSLKVVTMSFIWCFFLLLWFPASVDAPPPPTEQQATTWCRSKGRESLSNRLRRHWSCPRESSRNLLPAQGGFEPRTFLHFNSNLF